MSATLYEKINQVDWERLGVKDAPSWLIDLISDDIFTRLDAARWLSDKIIDLGQITLEEPPPLSSMLETEAVLYVVPILIEMLRDEITHKAVVLDLIRSSVSNVYLGMSEAEEPYRNRGVQLYEIAKTGTEVYRSLLNDPNPSIRNMARETLKHLETNEFLS